MPQDVAPILDGLKERVHHLAHGIGVAHHAYDHSAYRRSMGQSETATPLTIVRNATDHLVRITTRDVLSFYAKEIRCISRHTACRRRSRSTTEAGIVAD